VRRFLGLIIILACLALLVHDAAAWRMSTLRRLFDEEDLNRALRYAACKGRLERVKLLLAKGARIDAPDMDGCTPLFSRWPHIVQLLLDHGACPTTGLKGTGTMPLHLAAREGRERVAELLIAGKAPLNAEDRAGWTPLDYSITNNTSRCADVIRRNGGRSGIGEKNADLYRLLLQSDTATVRKAIESGADVAVRDCYGRTPLLMAAYLGRKDLVDLFLSKGADVNAADHTGRTALHWAADNRDGKCVQLLIAHGANINARTRTRRETPLDLVLRSRRPAFTPEARAVPDLLRKHGGKTSKELDKEAGK